MKLNYTSRAFFGFIFLLSFTKIYAQDDSLYQLLVQKNIISKADVDSLREAAAAKSKNPKEKKEYSLLAGNPLKLSGYIQGRYQYREEKALIDGFDLRRARLDLRGAIDKKWNYRLQAEFANSVKLLDASASYQFNNAFAVTLGQFKVPLSLESLTGASKLLTIDRSQVVEALTTRSRDVIGNSNGRDVGLQLSGNFLKRNEGYLFEYAAGIFNGAGANVSDNNDRKDIAARLIIHPVKGLDIAGNVYHGTGRWTLSSADAPANHLRNRHGFDVSYVSGPVSLAAEYLKGRDASIDREGWYAQAAYEVIPKKLQLLAKYDTYDPDLDAAANASHWYIGGANIFFSRWSKLQLNYTFKNEAGAEIHNDVFSAQLQLQF